MAAVKGLSLPSYYLKPGEIRLASEPVMVTTVLGSCICVTMYHLHTKFAAICHAVMPSIAGSAEKVRAGRNRFQYVDTSIEWMLDQFARNRINYRDIEVKLFGGAEMFNGTTQGRNAMTVGRKNLEMALETLDKNRLKIRAWNVGGDKGRKLIFNTLTGEVFAKFVNKADSIMTYADNRRKP